MKMKDNRLVLCLFLFAGAALHSHPSYANNGAVAIAVPMEGITIDGDLSDWPADMRRYPIMLPEFGVRPRDTEDFQGFFRIGYNRLENILYFAVEIHDESTVIDPTAGAEWNTQDGCEVYVNVEQKEKDASVVQYVIFGDTPRAGPYEVKVSREEKAHWYEWQIDIGEMSKGPVHLNPEMTIGVDVVVCDKDEDGSFSWMAWGRGAFKGSYADRLGDVILVEEDAELGVIQGTVKREEVEEGIAHAKVRFQSLTSERKLMVKTDRMGAYAIELPAGWYRVSAAELGRGARAHITAEVREGSEEEIALVVQTSRGQVVPAGPGKGHWQTFGIPDGLSSPIVLAIVEDRKGDLWFGTFGGGVSHYDGETFTTFNTEDGLVDNAVRSIVEDREGDLWFGTDGGLSRYDGETFTNYTTEDGLSDNNIFSIAEDREGDLWFGTFGEGVSRYDGETFTTYTTEEGLAHNWIPSILADREGGLWFGTQGGGVSHYDGQTFTTYTTEEGLGHNVVLSIAKDREGHLWFGTDGGLSRYDGETFTAYTIENGLVSNVVLSIVEDREGHLWFGTNGGGVSRYDGVTFTNYTTEDGLAHKRVQSILADRQGYLWFGTEEGGVSRYDGATFTNYTTEDGLTSNGVWAIVEDREGHLWFGTYGGGVSRYDGETFTNYTTEDGLADNVVLSLLEDLEGHLWFGTFGGGVSRYDRFVFQNLLSRDGLVYDMIHEIYQDRKGSIWIGTEKGITRYRPRHTPPLIHLTRIVADRHYGAVEEIRLPSSQKFLMIEFQGLSFKTRPGAMVFLYRLKGYEEEWQQTREPRVEYTDLPIGDYVFQVKAVDRDLDYSEVPAEVRIIMHLPYGQIALVGGLGIALLGLVLTSGYAVKRRQDQRRAERALMQELEEELQTAHDMQMGLMPAESPRISGFDISGRCIPANHVGGDFFQYFPISDNRLAISLADVTGHAMEAAVPVMMFSGILDNQMEAGDSLEDLFAKLNRSLHRNLNSRTFVCFAMGELDASTRQFRISNGGCPYPYHFQASTSEVTELQVDAYPLGVRAESTYPVIEAQLEPADRVVFCSDGIIEAENSSGEIFGFDRTAETIRKGCQEGLSASALLDRIIGEVKAFAGETPQGDDQTVVILRVES